MSKATKQTLIEFGVLGPYFVLFGEVDFGLCQPSITRYFNEAGIKLHQFY
jgi:hypothetical protein